MNKAAYTDAEISRQVVAAVEIVRALGDEDDELRHDMVEGQTDLFEAIEAALDEMRDCDAAVIGIDYIVEGLTSRKTRHVKRREKLKGLIEQALTMAEIKSHAFIAETLTIKKTPPKLIVTDESVIPSQYWTPQPPKLDRKALLDAVKAGPVAGAEKTQGGATLQIRTT